MSAVLRVFAIDWSNLNDGDEASDLHYGLKIVRAEDDATYENCRYFSAHDPNRAQLEELPIDAEQRYKLEKVLVEGRSF